MLLCRNKRIRPARRSTALALMMSVLVVTCASCAGGSLPAAEPPEPLVYGDIVRYGRPLFGSVEDERFPLPVIIPQCLTGEDIDTVTFDNFGKQVKLYLHERRVE